VEVIIKVEKINVDTIHRTKEYKELKQGLIDQLKFDGKENNQNLDLISDYMDMYVTKKLLKEDIFERGVTVEVYTAKGDVNYKKNDSITELTKVNMQMLRILQHLNISIGANGDADDEM
jgi:hypothetical protein